jgi:hypothetical protein
MSQAAFALNNLFHILIKIIAYTAKTHMNIVDFDSGRPSPIKVFRKFLNLKHVYK